MKKNKPLERRLLIKMHPNGNILTQHGGNRTTEEDDGGNRYGRIQTTTSNPSVGILKTDNRIWTLYHLSFIQVFMGSLFSIALPNVLLYSGLYSYSFIGWLSTVYAISFFISPIFLRRYCQRIGIKNALLLSAISNVFVIAAQIYLMIPSVLLIASFIDGMFTGLFWANVKAE